MLIILLLSGLALVNSAILNANETEILAIASVQAGPSMTVFKKELFELVASANRFKSVPGLFLQQDEEVPPAAELQLPNFGAKLPWPLILDTLTSASNRVLLLMIRHGEAWENINPLPNSACQFPYEKSMVPNLDSDLDDVGVEQAKQLNSLLKSDSSYANDRTQSWFDSMGLTNKVFYVYYLSILRTKL